MRTRAGEGDLAGGGISGTYSEIQETEVCNSGRRAALSRYHVFNMNGLFARLPSTIQLYDSAPRRLQPTTRDVRTMRGGQRQPGIQAPYPTRRSRLRNPTTQCAHAPQHRHISENQNRQKVTRHPPPPKSHVRDPPRRPQRSRRLRHDRHPARYPHPRRAAASRPPPRPRPPRRLPCLFLARARAPRPLPRPQRARDAGDGRAAVGGCGVV